jgi:DNA segregation ATPase FtsK/SpoIIIE-like protein
VKYVYLVRAGKGHYKVGIAVNMLNRVKALQTSNANLIEIVTAKQTPDAAGFERSLHEMLKERKLNGGSEWFELTDEQALDFAVLINQSPGMGISEIDAFRELLANYAELHQELLDRFDIGQKKVNARIEHIVNQINFDQILADHKKKIMEARTKAEHSEKVTVNRSEDQEMYYRAVSVVTTDGKASTSLLQRRLSIGYGRAARLIERMEKESIVGPADGARPRQVLDIHNEAVEIAKSRLDV